MKTLYFSSEGHASLGRLDVFKSTRLSDTSWTQWSEPVNLGKEINGSLDEYDYEISTDGNIAVFTAYKNFNVDIYSVFLPAEMKPSSVTTVSGHIIDQNGKQLDAGVKWENLANAELIGNLRSNPTNGTYIIVLPNGKNYGFFAEKQGYYPVAGNLDLKNININQNIQKDIVLVSTEEIISKNVSVTMNNLFFEYNKFDLKAESFSELNRFADFLKSQPNLKAEISGYTDNKGSADYNL
jgi:outer membrane protein OmpA-like peptidoglycan-associated protein